MAKKKKDISIIVIVIVSIVIIGGLVTLGFLTNWWQGKKPEPVKYTVSNKIPKGTDKIEIENRESYGFKIGSEENKERRTINKESEKKKYFVGGSKIHGKGVFAEKNLDENETIGLLHTINNPHDYTFTELGRLHNHNDEPNCHNQLINNQRFLVASRPINKGEELTTNYRLQLDLEQPTDWRRINKSEEREMEPEKDGYRTYSPFIHLEYIIVNSNAIDCDNIVYDLILVGDNGLIKYGPKNSGSYFLKGAKKVVELPLKDNENGEELSKDEKALKNWVLNKIKSVDKDLEIRNGFFKSNISNTIFTKTN
jgi:hypothetical protein